MKPNLEVKKIVMFTIINEKNPDDMPQYERDLKEFTNNKFSIKEFAYGKINENVKVLNY